MNRRRFFGLFTRAAAAAPFAALLPRWYGTAAQWALHAKEGVLRLAAQGRLAEVPGQALSRHPIPVGFVKYEFGSGFIFGPSRGLVGLPNAGRKVFAPAGARWMGHWQDAQGRILAWVDHTGRAWWAKP